MTADKTQILNSKEIEHRLNRIAYQIYEDNYSESHIILAGIVTGGYTFALMLQEKLKNICNLQIDLIKIEINKNEQSNKVKVLLTNEQLQGKVIILVDDVLNSGKTLMYALRPFLNADIKKIRTVVLIDRNHKRYPVFADYVGLSLATTLQEHVSVNLIGNDKAVYLK